MLHRNIKAIIFDRDGTLIEHVHYLSDPKEVRILPGVKTGLALLKTLGFKLFLHTNQSGVSRSLFSMEQVYACNQRMQELLELDPNLFERICIAPEKPDDPIVYRKPSSRFAKEVMKDFSFRSSEICYVGDSPSDLQTAISAGSKAIGVNTGLLDFRDQLKKLKLIKQFPIVDSFTEVVEYLISN